MEIAIDPSIPTYAGGLGILAGDMLRSAADLGLTMVGVTLLYRHGYFRQQLDTHGNQHEGDSEWSPEEQLTLMDHRTRVSIEGREIHIQAWRYEIEGIDGHHVPVYFLDTNLPENTPWHRTLTEHLYGGDHHYRLCQEAVLGMGGVSILRELGYLAIETYHMNEGHAALLTLALLEERLASCDLRTASKEDIDAIRRKCVFTTHTPVPAGHDQFPRDLAAQLLGPNRVDVLEVTHCCPDQVMNMTYLALRFSHYINGVAMHHGEVSQGMFPRYPVSAITNGVHAVTWTSPAFREVYDRHLPAWRRDNLYLRYAIGISLEEIRQAHAAAKRALIDEIKKCTGVDLKDSVLTIGFARRATAYKRADLLFSDVNRLKRIARDVGPLQVVYGGKAHPQDEGGKALIRRVVEASEQLKGIIPVVYLENYDMRLAQLLTSGCDLWLNTPLRPFEASGTSGMKAALNGVPSLSVLDGWWIEGNMEGFTGWAIGRGDEVEEVSVEIASLYDKLERIIVPMFYGRPAAFAEVMRSTIAVNGSFFNTQRMVIQYAANAYFQKSQRIDAQQLLAAPEREHV
jgi:starch phosphorylase